MLMDVGISIKGRPTSEPFKNLFSNYFNLMLTRCYFKSVIF